MAIVSGRPGVDELGDAVGALREWQREGAALQLHPGDLGWFWRFGAEATAAAVRTWSRDGDLLAVGLLDGSDLLRLGIAPEAQQDQELARQLVADATDPARGVLPEGEASVESPNGALIHDLLGAAGWALDDPWAILRRDLSGPVEDPELRVDVIAPAQAGVWAAVQRSAFDNPHATDDRWHAMASGVPYLDGRSLVAHDGSGTAVAAVTVWSAGPGRPGIIEPMGVHRDHRGQGYGTSINIAAAAALRQLGSSSAMVATPSDNVGAVTTYASAGFEQQPERRDRRRGAQDLNWVSG
ncbi:GNAT family N-acetyltransferase [Knoellia sp. S7-12]|uniref:GNAT family N-acetyltransferase n=1 Tax=Knoellia sp. S7-12 TaxID=3126698 RepID=UPI003367E360